MSISKPVEKFSIPENFVKHFVLAIVAATLTAACSKNGEPYDIIPKVELKGAGCLKQAPKAVEDFFNGSSNANEVTGLWNCFHYALNTFSTYVKGADKSKFSADELREFLENYFLQDQKKMPGDTHVISDKLLKEMLEVKRLFLGGNSASVTRAELLQTFDLIEAFNDISVGLIPHTDVLFGVSSRKATPISDQADDGLMAFDKAAQKLVRLLNNDHSQYQFANLSSLLHEMYLYFRNSNPDSTFKDYSQYVPIIAQIKGLLMNSDRSRIEANDWAALGPFLAKAYAIYLRTSYYLSGESLMAIDPLSEIRALMLDFSQILRQGITHRQGHALPLTDIRAVVSEAATLNLLPKDVDEDMANTLVSRLVDFILNPQNQFKESGISKQKLEYLESQVDDWANIQKALVLNIQLPQDPIWNEMVAVINGPWPLRLDTNGRVILDGDKKSTTNLDSNSRLNWARALFHLVFNAYVKDKDRREVTREMDKSEIHQAYLDLKPLLVVFGLVDKNDTTFDKRLFRDANLFMPRSDGDKHLSFNELVEYVHFIFSGINAGHLIIDNMQKPCLVSDSHVDVNCFRVDFKQKADTMLSHMPLQLSFVKTMSSGRWQKFIKNLEVVNRDEGAVSSPISRTAVYESYVLLQYIEVLMLRFDENRDGKLDLNESLKLLKLFLGTISSALNLDQENDRAEIESLFTYLLNYGTFPSLDDPISKLRYENWKLKQGSWVIGVDRADVLQIIAVLSKLGL